MSKLSFIADAIKQSYKNDGVAKIVAEGSSDVAQNILSPSTPFIAEALASAVIPSIPKALQRNPNAPFSPSYTNRLKAGLNSTKRLFPGAMALTAAGNIGTWIGDRITEGQDIKEKQRRDLAAGVFGGKIPAELLPGMKWVDEGAAYADYLKSLAPSPNFSFPTNYYHSFGGY